MNHESEGKSHESENQKQQFTSKVAGAVDFISKLDTREAQEEALSKYKDAPEIFNAINENFGGEFTNLLETQEPPKEEPPKEEIPEEKPEEKEEKKETPPDPARIAQEAAKLVRDEQTAEKLKSDLVSQGIRGEENLSRRLKAAQALLASGFEYDQAVSGAVAASATPAIMPSGGRAETTTEDYNQELRKYNEERKALGLPPAKEEYYKKAREQGLL